MVLKVRLPKVFCVPEKVVFLVNLYLKLSKECSTAYFSLLDFQVQICDMLTEKHHDL